MRRVFSNSSMVAHLWANQSQDTARAGSVSFTGADFYSYATAVATITHGANGQPVALFTSRYYSPTTCRHVSMAYGAASHLLRFTVPHLTGRAAHAQGMHGYSRTPPLSDPEAHAANLAALLEGFRASVAKLSRTLGKWPAEWSAYYVREAGDKVLTYADTFGLPRPDVNPAAEIEAARRAYLARQLRRNTPEAIRKRERARVRRIEKSRAESDRVLLARYGDWGSVAESFAGSDWHAARVVRDLLLGERWDTQRAEQAAQWEAQRAEREAREAREVAELEAERAANFPRWRSGERYFLPSECPVLLRVRGENVETSLGAVVPVSHARRLYRIVAQHRAAGEEWRANGHSLHVGPFTVSRIAPDGQLTAGCHVIEWPEIEALAVAQGWTGDSAPEALTVNSAADRKGVR